MTNWIYIEKEETKKSEFRLFGVRKELDIRFRF